MIPNLAEESRQCGFYDNFLSMLKHYNPKKFKRIEEAGGIRQYCNYVWDIVQQIEEISIELASKYRTEDFGMYCKQRGLKVGKMYPFLRNAFSVIYDEESLIKVKLSTLERYEKIIKLYEEFENEEENHVE